MLGGREAGRRSRGIAAVCERKGRGEKGAHRQGPPRGPGGSGAGGGLGFVTGTALASPSGVWLND